MDLLEQIARLLQQNQGDPELQAYLRDPSSRPDIERMQAPRPPLPRVNYTGYGQPQAAPPPAPPAPRPAPQGLPGFPGQARVGMNNLGEAARDVFGYATQGRGYRPPVGALSPERQAQEMARLPLNHRMLPMQYGAPSPVEASAVSMSATDAANPLNGSLPDYINSTMGLRPPPGPAPDREPWRQPVGAPRAGSENTPLPAGAPARVGGFAPPGNAPAQDEAARLNAEWNEAVRRARAAVRQTPDPTGLREQSRREIERMRLRRDLEQRLPRLMAYQDFNRNR